MGVFIKTKEGIKEVDLEEMEKRPRKTEKKKRVVKLPAWKKRYMVSRWADKTIERFNL